MILSADEQRTFNMRPSGNNRWVLEHAAEMEIQTLTIKTQFSLFFFRFVDTAVRVFYV